MVIKLHLGVILSSIILSTGMPKNSFAQETSPLEISILEQSDNGIKKEKLGEKQYAYNYPNGLALEVNFYENYSGFAVSVIKDEKNLLAKGKKISYYVNSLLEILDISNGDKLRIGLSASNLLNVCFLRINNEDVEDEEIIRLANEKFHKYRDNLSIDYLKTQLDSLKEEHNKTLKRILDEY